MSLVRANRTPLISDEMIKIFLINFSYYHSYSEHIIGSTTTIYLGEGECHCIATLKMLDSFTGWRRWRMIGLIIGWLVFALNFVPFIFLLQFTKHHVDTSSDVFYTTTLCSEYSTDNHTCWRCLCLHVSTLEIQLLFRFFFFSVIIFWVNLSWLYGVTFVSFKNKIK